MNPIRQRKHDRLMTPGASSAEIACDHAVAPFDRACRDMERKWGIDRLPELVAPEMSARFGKAMGVMNDAINAEDPDATAAAAANCVRGLQAMDAAATAAGHQPLNPAVWEVEYEGQRFGIIRDVEEWAAAAAQRPGMTLYTLREVAVALAASKHAVTAVKAAFPGAQVTAIRSPLSEELEDEIPWA